MLKMKYIEQMNYILTSNQKKWGCIVFILSLIGSVFELLGVSVIIPVIQSLLEPDTIWQNRYFVLIATYLAIDSKQEMIIFICVVAISLYLIKNSYLVMLSYIRIKFSCKIQREISIKMMNFYMRRGYHFFLYKNVSELMRGVGNSAASTYQVIVNFMKIVSEIITIVVIGIFVLFTNVGLAVCMCGIAAVCVFLIVCVFKKIVQNCGDKYHNYLAIVNKISYQVFEGIKEVLVMKRQNYFVKKYEEAYKKQQEAAVWQNVATESPAYVIEALSISILLIYVGMLGIGNGNIKNMIPELAAFAVAAFRILPSLGRISSGINMITFYIPAVNEVYNNFKEVELYDEETREDKKWTVSEFRDMISLSEIKWKYPNNEEYVLNDLKIQIEKGKSVALIGKSGAGKSTLGDVLLGLLRPESGRFEIDGKEILNYGLNWNKKIGFVSQTFYLNDDTIRNNVAYGIDENEIRDDYIWKALEQAQLKEFVEELPEKLDTIVGERGIRFSGGQRQRIAIARALYYDPEILIMDEATSALDNETENTVMEAIGRLQGMKTLVIIAHRLTTIKNCDYIYEIKNGKAYEISKEEVQRRIENPGLN